MSEQTNTDLTSVRQKMQQKRREDRKGAERLARVLESNGYDIKEGHPTHHSPGFWMAIETGDYPGVKNVIEDQGLSIRPSDYFMEDTDQRLPREAKRAVLKGKKEVCMEFRQDIASGNTCTIVKFISPECLG